MIYDQPDNEGFWSVQYNVSLAITGAITGTSRLKLYNEIGLEMNLDDISENSEPFTKLKVLVSLHTCLILFQKTVTCTILAP